MEARFYVFELVAGDGGENVGGAGVACGAGCADFSDGVHEAAVADGSEQKRQSEIEAEDAGARGCNGRRRRRGGGGR